MYKKNEPAIVNHPYPTGGGRWRCFDGEKWHYCDRKGKVMD